MRIRKKFSGSTALEVHQYQVLENMQNASWKLAGVNFRIVSSLKVAPQFLFICCRLVLTKVDNPQDKKS
jgi:hypothetical protein